MPTSSFASLLEQVGAHARADDLAALALEVLLEAAAEPGADWRAIVSKRCRDKAITGEQATTGAGNVVQALEHATDDPAAARLVAAMAARALRQSPPRGVDAEDTTALQLIRVALTSGVEVMAALDDLAPELAGSLWGAVADALQRHDAHGDSVTRAEAVVAAGMLLASTHATARERRAQLASSLHAPMLARLVGATDGALPVPDTALSGEIAAVPRGPVATLFLGLCGWLLVSNVARLLARLALQYRRPVELRVTAKGVLVKSSTRLLGKVLRESESLLPLGGLARATREVRFPRAATYAGLLALAVGSYVGVSWFVDGVRASSFSLAATGLLVMALGIGLDFLLLSVLPGRQGKCRLLLVPKRGAVTCVGGVDADAADAMLRTLSGRA